MSPLPMNAQMPTVGEAFHEPARFVVTTDVVNEDVPGITATIGSIGNSWLRSGGGFEPVNWRSRWFASKDGDNRIFANNLHQYDSLREGFLDGAQVRVYRIVDGKMTLVRQDTVAEGGHAISKWRGNIGRLIAPEQTSYTFAWASFNRPDVPYYFALQAIDKNGNRSEPSNALSFVRPANVGGKSGPTKQFRAPGNPSESDAPAAPGNLQGTLQEDGSLQLTWDASSSDDLAGYLLLRSDYAPENHRGEYLQLAGRAQSEQEKIRRGDMFIVSKTFYEGSRKKHHANRVWDANRNNKDTLPGLLAKFYPDENPDKTWRLVPHTADTPVSEPGETYLEIELGAGQSHTLSDYNHSGSAQYWYDVLEPGKDYVVEFWMKYEGAETPQVTFKGSGLHENEIAPGNFTPTGEWQQHRHTFQVSQVKDSSRASQMSLQMQGSGKFSIDNFRIYRADTEYLDYLPRFYDRLEASGMISLRTHGPIKTGTTTYSMEQYTNPGGVIENIRLSNTLPQALKIMRKADVIPWLQIEWHMSPEEWLGFVEFMAAPYDPAVDTPESKPWAFKRYSQGQAKPWVDEFDKFWFEIGNENWNWLFNPWVFEGMPDAVTGENWQRGKVYGLFQEHVRDVLRSSPYWSAELDEKFEYVLGGWRHQNFSAQAAATSPNSLHVQQAAYNGGWDEGEGPPSTTPPSYFNVLAQVNQTAGPAARDLLEIIRDASASHGGTQVPGTYEAGPGYALNGLNNARVSKEQARQQEEVMKSLAGGTATLDSFLIRAYYGAKVQNFFTFSEGERWTSHAEWYNGGQAFPCWKVLEVFNKYGTGDILRTQTTSVPTADLAKFKRRQGVDDAPLAAVYASRDGDRLTLFVISRKIPNFPIEGDDGFIPLSVELPFTQFESLRVLRMAGDHTAHNIFIDQVGFEEMEMPAGRFDGTFVLNAKVGADDRGLPPAATLVYVFEGTNMGSGQTIDPVALLTSDN
ncbi:MAG: carbohydrate binding domain-containing protein [Opitutales bacterium]